MTGGSGKREWQGDRLSTETWSRVLACFHRAEFRHPVLVARLTGQLSEALAGQQGAEVMRQRMAVALVRFRSLEVLGQAGSLIASLFELLNFAKAEAWAPEVALLLCAIGRIRYAQGEYREAAQHWAQAVDIAKLCQRPDAEIDARIGLGQVYDALGDSHSAARMHGDAAVLAKVLQDDYLISKVAINRGFNLRAIQRLPEAQAQFQEALAAARRGKVRHYVAESLWQLAALSLDLGALGQAHRHAQEARRMAEQAGNGWLLSGVMRTLADLYRRESNKPAAMDAYRQALALSEATGARRQQADCHAALSELSEQAGDLVDALAHARASHALQSDLLRQLNVTEKLEDLRQYELSEKTPIERLLSLTNDPRLQNLDEASALAFVCQTGLDTLDADSVSVWSWTEGGAQCIARAVRAPERGGAITPALCHFIDSLRPQMEQATEPRVVQDVRMHPEFHLLREADVEPFMSACIEVPVHRDGILVGVLYATRMAAYHPWTRDQVLFSAHLGALVNQLLASQQIRRMFGELQASNERLEQRVRERTRELEQLNRSLADANAALLDASLTDTLTGLRNRRYLLQQIDGDVALALRHVVSGTHGLVFYIVDIDHFKLVNDRFGHEAGDQVLVQAAKRLLACTRKSCHVVRWGGEEFLVVSRGAEAGQAHAQAERIRSQFADEPFLLPDGEPLAVRCSVGFAVFPFRSDQGHVPWAQVMSLADQALYRAKAGGRNAWVGVLPSDDALLPPGELDLDLLEQDGLVRVQSM